MKERKYRSILIICVIMVFTAMPLKVSGIAGSVEIQVSSYNDLKNAFSLADANTGNTYIAELNSDIEVAANNDELKLNGGNLTIIGNSHEINYVADTKDSGIKVNGGTLKLGNDGTDGGLIISGCNNEHEHPLVQVTSGYLYLCPGTELSGNINSGIGGGIYAANGSNLIITGGSIINNTASMAGGVYLEGNNTIVNISGAITINNNCVDGNPENVYFAGTAKADTATLSVKGSLSGSHIGICMEQEKLNGLIQVNEFTVKFRSFNSGINPATVFYEDNPGFYITYSSTYTDARSLYYPIDVTVPNTLDLYAEASDITDFSVDVTNNSAYNIAYITSISCNCNDGWQLLPLEDERIIESVDQKLWGLQIDAYDLYGNAGSYSKRTLQKRSTVSLSCRASFGSSISGIYRQSIATVVFTISNK